MDIIGSSIIGYNFIGVKSSIGKEAIRVAITFIQVNQRFENSLEKFMQSTFIKKKNRTDKDLF